MLKRHLYAALAALVLSSSIAAVADAIPQHPRTQELKLYITKCNDVVAPGSIRIEHYTSSGNHEDTYTSLVSGSGLVEIDIDNVECTSYLEIFIDPFIGAEEDDPHELFYSICLVGVPLVPWKSLWPFWGDGCSDELYEEDDSYIHLRYNNLSEQ